MPRVSANVRMFVPEHWGEVEYFQRLYVSTYKLSERDQRAINGVMAHFAKAQRLIQIAQRQKANLSIDEDELEKRGFTTAGNASELATIIEAAILELYSVVDCVRKVLYAVYERSSRGFKESTRKLFQSPESISGAFPDELKELLKGAGWYPRLLHLRDELTHLDTGHVRRDRESGTVEYLHFGLKDGDKTLVIDDIFGWFDTTSAAVNQFAGLCFRHMSRTFSDREVFQLCGLVDGRVLHRYLRPVRPVTFDSGRCGAWVWFELPENPSCPFSGSCGAYRDKAPPPEADPPVVV